MFLFKFLNLKNLSSAAGKKTTRFLLDGASDSYVPYVRCVGWKPRLTEGHSVHLSTRFNNTSNAVRPMQSPSVTGHWPLTAKHDDDDDDERMNFNVA